ncbi:hypothetical protein CR513_48596, partial [Mucuna pruriens]
MGHMSYNRVSSGRGSSCHGKCRGFRLNIRRLYFLRLRKRFTFLLTLFDRWKLSYAQALQLLKKVFRRKTGFKRNYSNSSTTGLVRDERIKGQGDYSYGRNNSFYAEAIADCLEFIKRTSISSMDQIEDPVLNCKSKALRRYSYFSFCVYEFRLKFCIGNGCKQQYNELWVLVIILKI